MNNPLTRLLPPRPAAEPVVKTEPYVPWRGTDDRHQVGADGLPTDREVRRESVHAMADLARQRAEQGRARAEAVRATIPVGREPMNLDLRPRS